MNVESVADEITEELRKVGLGSRQGHRPSAQQDFGVYVPDMRKIVKVFRKRVADEDGETVYRLGLALLSRNIYECRHVAYELIAGHEGASESLTAKRVEALGAGIDNWACVDTFCCSLVGQAWREGRISDATIQRWSRSRDVWWRRAAVSWDREAVEELLERESVSSLVRREVTRKLLTGRKNR